MPRWPHRRTIFRILLKPAAVRAGAGICGTTDGDRHNASRRHSADSSIRRLLNPHRHAAAAANGARALVGSFWMLKKSQTDRSPARPGVVQHWLPGQPFTSLPQGKMRIAGIPPSIVRQTTGSSYRDVKMPLLRRWGAHSKSVRISAKGGGAAVVAELATRQSFEQPNIISTPAGVSWLVRDFPTEIRSWMRGGVPVRLIIAAVTGSHCAFGRSSGLKASSRTSVHTRQYARCRSPYNRAVPCGAPSGSSIITVDSARFQRVRHLVWIASAARSIDDTAALIHAQLCWAHDRPSSRTGRSHSLFLSTGDRASFNGGHAQRPVDDQVRLLDVVIVDRQVEPPLPSPCGINQSKHRQLQEYLEKGRSPSICNRTSASTGRAQLGLLSKPEDRIAREGNGREDLSSGRSGGDAAPVV
ncbi:unnamed protein product [Acanthosepion pharaonis]|uniref:Uncharacterized protein n=1 Tax=Acanthosepion pharaonis TaxID=158019 RepID=A0A812D999_ACAPH|nr:unnamed protein product [Sepia pharaonis]